MHMEVDRNTARERGLQVLKLEAEAIRTLQGRIDESFEAAVEAILASRRRHPGNCKNQPSSVLQ